MMKSILLTVFLAALSLSGFSQRLNKAKDLYTKQKLAEAKTEIDNFLAIEKNADNSDAWYVKTQIYNALMKDSTLAASKSENRKTAWESLLKYNELEQQKDSAKRHLQLTLDNRQPVIDIYSSFSQDGASFYNANNFNDALTNFKSSLEIFEFMADNGFITDTRLDTVTTLYAGISAEKANKPEEAARFYGNIANAKAKDEGYVEIYKWLADHYKRKGEIDSATHYLTLGKEVFPEDEFWGVYELEMLREQSDKTSLFKKYEEVIQKNPDDHLNRFNYAVELYQTAYDADSANRPENSKELIGKAVEQLKESLKLQPDFPNANLVLGQILYNQGVDISLQNSTIRPKDGGRLTAAQTAEKERLRGLTNEKYDEAKVYFEKVDQSLGSQGKLKPEEKRFLKEAYDLLIMIYEQQKNKDKADEYTEKFNNVEKDH